MSSSGFRWKDREVEKLRQLVASGLDSTSIANQIGRSQAAVKNKAFQLGLAFLARKDHERRLAQPDCEDMEGINKKACQQHLEDLQAAYPNGLIVKAPAPSKGGPRYFTPEPCITYRSAAAMLAEG